MSGTGRPKRPLDTLVKVAVTTLSLAAGVCVGVLMAFVMVVKGPEAIFGFLFSFAFGGFIAIGLRRMLLQAWCETPISPPDNTAPPTPDA